MQTLSRLNRVAPGKDQTFVLDFANSAEDIVEAFEPYYEATTLADVTDPNIVAMVTLSITAKVRQFIPCQTREKSNSPVTLRNRTP